MRKDQFIEAVAIYNKRRVATFIIGYLIFIAYVAGFCTLIAHRFDAYFDSRFAGLVSEVMKPLPMTLPIMAALPVLILIVRKLDRKLGVACPHCGKPLAKFKAIVIASKKCPHCGMNVLEDNLEQYA
ncbi:MAG: hypothetical protein ABSA83_10385 [Verrucomicrobiota bacterium]